MTDDNDDHHDNQIYDDEEIYVPSLFVPALATVLALAVGTVLALWTLFTPDPATRAAGDFVAVSDWAQLRGGRTWGAVTGVYPDPDGRHMWVLDRCGANSCIDSELDPVFKFDLNGGLVANFGGGLFAWPHGFFVDNEGNVWAVSFGPVSLGWLHIRKGAILDHDGSSSRNPKL